MPVIRAQVVLPHVSGVPKDNVVNTFHFDSASGDQLAHEAVHAQIVAFYNTAQSPGYSVGSLLNRAIDRTVGACKIKTYNLGPGPEGSPDLITGFGLAAPYDASMLPAEVALCVSYFAGQNAKRYRGRLYLGPLIGSIVGVEAQTNRAMVDLNARRTIAQAAADLIAASMTQQWAVFSRVDNVARVVTSGWVDDAFDTQRRRGEKATSRTVFAVNA